MAYKMKGSPMQRNFGIGSPLKQPEQEQKLTRKQRKAKKLEQKTYNRMLDELNVTQSDTLVSGTSKSHSLANMIASSNYRKAFYDPKKGGSQTITNTPTSGQQTVYNRKTGQYTTYVKGPKP
tara:strand:+ start:241 stop:606 length:366 start_codon:yes stop_codon:yes gene_type:complete